MRTGKGYLFGACYSKEVSYYHLCFNTDLKACRSGKALLVGNKEDFGYALIGMGKLSVC